LITIRPEKFEPAEITRQVSGQFLLAIENRSGIEDLDLKLSKQGGEVVREIHFSSRLLDWRGVVDLAPGQYVITEAKHSAWGCRITVD
jgi:hypothetical protein